MLVTSTPYVTSLLLTSQQLFFSRIQTQLNEDWQCVEGSCKLFVMIFQQVNHRITHQGNVWVSVAVNISCYLWGTVHFYFFTMYFLELIKNWAMLLVYINLLHMYKYKKKKICNSLARWSTKSLTFSVWYEIWADWAAAYGCTPIVGPVKGPFTPI